MDLFRTYKHHQAPARRRLLPILIGEILAVGTLSGAQAATINVAAGAVYINNNGVCSLIEAIHNAQQGATYGDCAAGDPLGQDTVNLASGSLYSLDVLVDTTDGNNGLPTITSKITINGNGSTIERDDMADPFRIFHVGASGNLALVDLTLRNGSVTGSSSATGSGGAVFNRGILGTFNSTFSYNSAIRGGAIRNDGQGILSVTNSTLSQNTAVGNGGALANNGMTAILLNSTVTGNAVTNTSAKGGGIYNAGSSTLTVSNSTVSGNDSRGRGGGIFTWGISVLNNSALTFNTTRLDGGGIYNASFGQLAVSNSTLAGNTAASDGGALWNSHNAVLTNSTLSGNVAYSGVGGAIVNESSDTLFLTNVTLANNIAVAGGSGLWSAANDFVTMNNTIIADSAGGANCVGFLDTAPSSNLFDDNSCGGAISNTIDLDTVLMDNGGPTLTHALLSGSAAIDAGDTTVCADDARLDFDQRGLVRDNFCDIGAFEFDAVSFLDVPRTYWAWSMIEKIAAAGITGGCGAGNYCPEALVTRAQMAVFLLRGIYGGAYIPPSATGAVFNDVPVTAFAAAWIEQLSDEGITGGCGSGNYCPNAAITRAQMAVFLLRAKYGSAYQPPPATGTVFGDVPVNAFAAAWIEQLVTENITGGCGNGNYCPNSSVTRAQMAAFLVRTFGL
ncbi:MAG: S-layer homology domain-containing protein [Gammaproteobacteria bacterium]|nr:S-layer homology domain-containing protein [Gammaproteobacteria bacterium]MCP5423887.1 S-layer homology domain-containing protein [Gammaproteobacteria bacterium]